MRLQQSRYVRSYQVAEQSEEKCRWALSSLEGVNVHGWGAIHTRYVYDKTVSCLTRGCAPPDIRQWGASSSGGRLEEPARKRWQECHGIYVLILYTALPKRTSAKHESSRMPVDRRLIFILGRRGWLGPSLHLTIMVANERPLTFSMELALQDNQTYLQRKTIRQHLYQLIAVRRMPNPQAASSIPDTNYTANSASGVLEMCYPGWNHQVLELPLFALMKRFIILEDTQCKLSLLHLIS